MRVGLIGCGAAKVEQAAPAAELYTGPFYRLCRQWMTKPGRVDEWGILSAKYGLVLPETVIEPYDLALKHLHYRELCRWREQVHEQLMRQWGAQVIYMVLAGDRYCSALSRMPMVEDVIAHWTNMRKLNGMRRPQMGIGVIKRYLLEDRSFGA